MTFAYIASIYAKYSWIIYFIFYILIYPLIYKLPDYNKLSNKNIDKKKLYKLIENDLIDYNKKIDISYILAIILGLHLIILAIYLFYFIENQK